MAQVGLHLGQFPGLEMGQRGGQGQPGIGRGGGGADLASARRSGPWCPARISGMAAVQQLDQQGPVAAGGGVLEGAYRLVLIGPPAGGHRVQLGRPPRPRRCRSASRCVRSSSWTR